MGSPTEHIQLQSSIQGREEDGSARYFEQNSQLGFGGRGVPLVSIRRRGRRGLVEEITGVNGLRAVPARTRTHPVVQGRGRY